MKILVLFVSLALTVVNVSAADHEPVEVIELVKTTKSWDGNMLPKYPQGQPEITILRITVQPGVKLGWHTHPVNNAGVILRGNLTVVTKDGKTNILGPGDALAEVVNTVHRGINNGDEEVELIVFYAGGKGMPITEK